MSTALAMEDESHPGSVSYFDPDLGLWVALPDPEKRSYDSEGNDPPVNTTRLFADLRAQQRGRFDA